MDYLKSISTYDIDDYTAGADVTSPLADVSNSSEPMQTWTSASNGLGGFFDTLGGIAKAGVDYAIKRDAYTMGMPMPGQYSAATGQQVLAQRQQSNGLFLLLIGVSIYMVAKS